MELPAPDLIRVFYGPELSPATPGKPRSLRVLVPKRSYLRWRIRAHEERNAKHAVEQLDAADGVGALRERLRAAPAADPGVLRTKVGLESA